MVTDCAKNSVEGMLFEESLCLDCEWLLYVFVNVRGTFIINLVPRGDGSRRANSFPACLARS